MTKITFAQSLADTGKMFAQVQIRPDGDGLLHLQGRGSNGGNRDYGIACKVAVPSAFTDWLAEQDAPLSSLAGTAAKYVPAQVRLTTHESQVKFQVQGTDYNRSYGAALHFTTEEVNTSLVNWLRANKPSTEEDDD